MELLLFTGLAAGTFVVLRDPGRRAQVRAVGRRPATHLPTSSRQRDVVPPRRLRPWAVWVLGSIAVATQLFLVAVMAGTVLFAHLVAIVATMVLPDAGRPEVGWRLATALFGTPVVLGPLAVLGCATAITVAMGRRPTVTDTTRGVSPAGPRRRPRGGSRPAG